MSTVPVYIQQADIRGTSVRYPWDQWNVEGSLPPLPEGVPEQLKSISLRADFAVLVGAAEWTIFRFDDLCDDSLPFEALDAAWTQMIDARYGLPWNPFDPTEWSGAVKGPMRHAVGLMQDYADLLGQRVEVATGAAKMLQLAALVVPDNQALSTWRDLVLDRLTKLFPRRPEDPLGDPVPREAVDPAYPFEISEIETLVNRYLAQVDPADNEFLQLPEALVEQGFEGTPYVFDLEQDRRRRLR